MPPKAPKDSGKKPPPPVVRLPISASSLMYVPEDAVEGYQERIETGIDWTLIEEAARHHKRLCQKENIPRKTFSEAFQTKIDSSIIGNFLNENSGLTLQQQWEFLYPITLWDNEKFATDEGKICFKNENCLTDDMEKLIKDAVKYDSREVLKRELKLVKLLRVNDSQGTKYLPPWMGSLGLIFCIWYSHWYLKTSPTKMTELDKGLTEFKKLITLNLCGNYIKHFNARRVPQSVKTIELQANGIENVEDFADYLPPELLYLGLGRNILRNEACEGLSCLPSTITVLDLSDNDIYSLDLVLDAVTQLPSLAALSLAGNPCSVCAGYARTTLSRLPRLMWLDSREVLPTDRSHERFDPHPDDLRAAYFTFNIFRVMSAIQPPRPEKGASIAFHIEVELPLLDSKRRQFLMFRRHESLIELLPPPEDDEWGYPAQTSQVVDSGSAVAEEAVSEHESDIYKTLTVKDSRLILNYTVFESNKIQWSKIMNFQEPTVKIFCPDLFALRDTFRSIITVKLIYSLNITTKPGKLDKKSASTFKPLGEQRVTLATVRCHLQKVDWSKPSQHFHWDDSLGTNDAIHWGDGDLSVLQYSLAPAKPVKGKPETDVGSSTRQIPPDNLTCHFGFGINTLTV